mgnify:CR=1 FL=1
MEKIPFSPPDITQAEIDESGGYLAVRLDHHRSQEQTV